VHPGRAHAAVRLAQRHARVGLLHVKLVCGSAETFEKNRRLMEKSGNKWRRNCQDLSTEGTTLH
jgi:hypothetical protein